MAAVSSTTLPSQSLPMDEDDFLLIEDVPDLSICTVCKSTRLEPIDNGAFYACVDCGTQVQGVVEEATEAFETSVGWSGRKRSTGGRKKKQPTADAHVEEKETVLAENAGLRSMLGLEERASEQVQELRETEDGVNRALLLSAVEERQPAARVGNGQ